MRHMTIGIALASLGGLLLDVPVLIAQRGGTAPHLAAAKAVADRPEHVRLFNALCVAPPPAPAQPAAPAAPRAGGPPREQWRAEPAKVFDNLYLVGQGRRSTRPGPSSHRTASSSSIRCSTTRSS